MNILSCLAFCSLSLAAQAMESPNQPERAISRDVGVVFPSSHPFSGLVLGIHTAVPTGALGRDVDQKLGFGFSVGYQHELWPKIGLRTAFQRTGYRVNDRNLLDRMLAGVFDNSYDEDRLVLRSYALGVDLIGYQHEGCHGVYAFAGGGIQRSRMYLERRYVYEGDATVEDIARWPAMNSAYLNLGIGKQFRNPAFVEAKLVAWRYRAVPGFRLMETPLGVEHHYRDALSVSLGVGVRF